ncbi:MAG: hypothetical protein R2824_26075 [Saprospiraceae bacterium]
MSELYFPAVRIDHNCGIAPFHMIWLLIKNDIFGVQFIDQFIQISDLKSESK